ncbi:hypothetical protein V5799_022107, partial [Amblyomma americanum]
MKTLTKNPDVYGVAELDVLDSMIVRSLYRNLIESRSHEPAAFGTQKKHSWRVKALTLSPQGLQGLFFQDQGIADRTTKQGLVSFLLSRSVAWRSSFKTQDHQGKTTRRLR